MTRPIPELSEKDTARFWAKVDVRGADECWPWTGASIRAGYGMIAINGSAFISSRVALAIDNRDPLDLLACHSCDNPPCCNPAHLFAGTHSDNVRDRDTKGRRLPPIGAMNGRAKISADVAMEIRNASGLQREIAARFGIGQSQVSRIKRRQEWK